MHNKPARDEMEQCIRELKQEVIEYRKEAEALREKEERYRTAIEKSVD
ncbi:hypothetical protein ACFLZG_03480 [Thermodesulfobacteriota bacterium]